MRTFVAALALVSTLAATAHAGPAPLAPEPPKVEARWYGWETLLVDGVAIAMSTTAAMLQEVGPAGESPSAGVHVNDTLGVAGAALYVLGAPAVHLANENFRVAPVSLAMHVAGAALFLGGAMVIAFNVPSDCTSFCFVEPNPALIPVGAALMSVALVPPIVDAILARKPAKRREAASALRVYPAAAPARGGATVGVVGSF